MPSASVRDEAARFVSSVDEDAKNGNRSQLSLFQSYLKLFREFRRQDLIRFCDRHDELYRIARSTGDHRDVTRHYYELMASVIATYYGEGWHFCPPVHQGQSRRDATIAMYRRIAQQLELAPDHHALDIGCGVGGMLRFLAAETGATITGITLGENEVVEANQLAAQQGLESQCTVVEGDSQEMPFEDQKFDSAFAVYALKYYPTLHRVFSEIHRVLKPGGRFSAYCLCKSNQYDASKAEHVELLNQFEYSTAMPSLHSVQSMKRVASEFGLRCVAAEDLSVGKLHWYSYWVSNPVLPWAVRSRMIYGLTSLAETLRILPSGFARFNDTFLAGTLRHIIRGGQTGVLTGSALLTFEKDVS